MVGGLVATVALPAYGAWRPAADALTLQQVAADDAQSLVVASDSTNDELARGSYSATTPEEIQKKKDEAAAAEAAAARARISASVAASLPVDVSMTLGGQRRGALADPQLHPRPRAVGFRLPPGRRPARLVR